MADPELMNETSKELVFVTKASLACEAYSWPIEHTFYPPTSIFCEPTAQHNHEPNFVATLLSRQAHLTI